MAGQFQLVMRSGPTPGAVYPLEGDQLTIGRDSANTISINDAEVSRRHSRLTFQGGKYVVEDLGSTNGTFVNGQRLSGPYVLKAGDVVALGEQIVLMYDAVNIDPGATMVSPRAAARPGASPSTPVSTPSTPPPVQSYSGQVPASPSQQTTTKPTNLIPILIVVAVLILICACGAFFWWVDATYRWCVFFPFLSGCGG
ncbi:MAG TPA: FHA domain-containing protein [Anaerolineales bacterium]|nr:FHA domain-containing protein [Anaerolineales bacterium]